MAQPDMKIGTSAGGLMPAMTRRLQPVTFTPIEPPLFEDFAKPPAGAPAIPKAAQALGAAYNGYLGDALGAAVLGHKASLTSMSVVSKERFDAASLSERRDAAAGLQELLQWGKAAVKAPDARIDRRFKSAVERLDKALNQGNRLALAVQDIHHQMQQAADKAMGRGPDHTGASLMQQIIQGGGRVPFSWPLQSNPATRPPAEAPVAKPLAYRMGG